MNRKSALCAAIAAVLFSGGLAAQQVKVPSGDSIVPNGACTAIPDNGYADPNAGTTGMACITVPGQNLIITDLNVQVALDHTWIGDVTMKLVPPSGSPIVTLVNRPGLNTPSPSCCGDSSNLLETSPLTFDGQAADDPETMGNTIADGQVVCQDDGRCTYTTNAGLEAAGALSVFNGTNASGNWMFCVGDSAAQDTGQICSATLQITGTAPSADLSITITNNLVPPPAIGSQFQYTVTVANAGPGGATGVAATVNLAPNLTAVSNTCGATGGPSTFNWAVGALANGANAQCDFTVQVNGPGSITTTGSVTGNEADPTPGNNSASSVLGGIVTSVPTLGTKALAALMVVLAGLGLVVLRRRRTA